MVALSLTLGTLFGWHIYLIIHNMTTIEVRYISFQQENFQTGLWILSLVLLSPMTFQMSQRPPLKLKLRKVVTLVLLFVLHPKK